MHDMLLDEPAIEDLTVQDLVAAVGRAVDEPGDHLQCAWLVAHRSAALAPHGDVVGPQCGQGCAFAVLDGGEHPVGDVVVLRCCHGAPIE